MDIDCNLASPKNGRVFANSKGGTLMILDQASGEIQQFHRYAPGTSVGTLLLEIMEVAVSQTMKLW